MAGTAAKIGIGCGIGCLVVLLALGGIGTCTYLGVRDLADDAKQMTADMDALHDRFGPATNWTPPADGAVYVSRMEAFLAVRERLLVDGAEVSRYLQTLDGAEGAPGGIAAKARAGVKLVPALVTYTGAMSSALLDEGMGLGEYTYIYTLGYYVLLGKDPGAGPGFRVTGDDEPAPAGDGEGFHLRTQGGWRIDGGDHRGQRGDEARTRLNLLFLALLSSQREAAAAAGADADVLVRLDAELAALADDSQRLPWQDGLPDEVAASLRWYGDRLEATWEPWLNSLEVAFMGDQ